MTIRSIAKEAGVAASTVSLVLNNKPGVRPETRSRIAAALVQNGYTIRSNSSQTIEQGEIKFIRYQSVGHQNERNQDFFAGLLTGAEKRARLEHCNLSITSVSFEMLSQVISRLSDQSNLLGVVFLASEITSDVIGILKRLTHPLVLIDCPLDYCPFNRIDIDNVGGAFTAVRSLYALGHRTIGFLRGATEIGGLHGRYEGYLKAMESLGLAIHPEHIVSIDLLFDTATDQMLEHLTHKPSLPTAFFAGNDIIAAGCVRALQQAGYHVPEDISVIGFDDGIMSTFVSPPLTTLRINRALMGELAVERLLSIRKSPHGGTLKTELSVSLVKRHSAAPPTIYTS